MMVSTQSNAALAERYNISIARARRWEDREESEDRSHRPHIQCTTLTPGQEVLVVELRRSLFLPLDDPRVVAGEFIHPALS